MARQLPPVIRFLLSGGLNTLLTFCLYWLLLLWVHYQVAYAVSYVAGIALGYLLNVKFVFRVRHSMRKAALFPFVYLINYVCGAAIVALVVNVLRWDVRVAPLIAILLTLPLTFLLTRRLLAN
jgi:putative flippase GtrA